MHDDNSKPFSKTPTPKTIGNGADSLKGQILIAMPEMNDPRFHHSIIVMLEHGPEGAMGVIINKPLEAVQFPDLLDQLDIPQSAEDLAEYPVYFGGPVEIGRGFVLHSTDVMLEHTLSMPPIAVTTSMDMLAHIANGNGPKNSMFCLGYTGWSAGQLDDEIKQNAWLHTSINVDLLFHLSVDVRWDAALALAGIDPDFLSATAGNA